MTDYPKRIEAIARELCVDAGWTEDEPFHHEDTPEVEYPAWHDFAELATKVLNAIPAGIDWRDFRKESPEPDTVVLMWWPKTPIFRSIFRVGKFPTTGYLDHQPTHWAPLNPPKESS